MEMLADVGYPPPIMRNPCLLPRSFDTWTNSTYMHASSCCIQSRMPDPRPGVVIDVADSAAVNLMTGQLHWEVALLRVSYLCSVCNWLGM